MQLNIPANANQIINQLKQQGYEAYAVGGCVRDMVLGREPEDWDITTSATPQEVKRIFRRTVDTGIQHGTVTVLIDKEHYEVTTYRLDGVYEDNRHPREVSFTSSLTEDLKRRDFTINAMAYNEQEGVIDLFGGVEDIRNRLIRCVGSAEERFGEDALRILRAVRFSAQLDFEIEEDTLNAVRSKTSSLANISAERIRVELTKLLVSDYPQRLRILYDTGITSVVLPEFDVMMKTEQKNIHHIYSVGEHTIRTVAEVAGKRKEHRFDLHDRTVLRWTMLLHDVDKPNTVSIGKDGQNHYYGHQEQGAVTAKQVLRRLKFDNDTIDRVVHLVRWHDYRFEQTPSGMRKAMSKIGKEAMELLFEVKRADTSAKNPDYWQQEYDKLEAAIQLYRDILARDECVSLKELNISGRELIAIGMEPGRQIGQLLNMLLDKVLEEPELNKRDSLLALAKDLRIQEEQKI